MNELVYYVYQVNLTDEKGNVLDEVINFCTSSVRWATLEKEIKNRDFLMEHKTLKLFHTTKDRNEARGMATEF